MNDAAYRTIFDALRGDILSGRYASGRRLPSVGTLVNRFGVARATVHHAVEELARQGLVQGRQGSGTFVRKIGASRKIGLIVPGVAVTDFFKPIVSEVNRLAREAGYELRFGEVWSERREERIEQVRELAARRPHPRHRGDAKMSQTRESFSSRVERVDRVEPFYMLLSLFGVSESWRFKRLLYSKTPSNESKALQPLEPNRCHRKSMGLQEKREKRNGKFAFSEGERIGAGIQNDALFPSFASKVRAEPLHVPEVVSIDKCTGFYLDADKRPVVVLKYEIDFPLFTVAVVEDGIAIDCVKCGSKFVVNPRLDELAASVGIEGYIVRMPFEMCAHEPRVSNEPFWAFQRTFVVAARPSFYTVKKIEAFEGCYVVFHGCLGYFKRGGDFGYVPELGRTGGEKCENGAEFVELAYLRNILNVVPEQMVDVVPMPCSSFGRSDTNGFGISAAKGKGENLLFVASINVCGEIAGESHCGEVWIGSPDLSFCKGSQSDGMKSSSKAFRHIGKRMEIGGSCQKKLPRGVRAVNLSLYGREKRGSLLNLVDEESSPIVVSHKTLWVFQSGLEEHGVVKGSGNHCLGRQTLPKCGLAALTSTYNRDCAPCFKRCADGGFHPSFVEFHNKLSISMSRIVYYNCRENASRTAAKVKVRRPA